MKTVSRAGSSSVLSSAFDPLPVNARSRAGGRTRISFHELRQSLFQDSHHSFEYFIDRSVRVDHGITVRLRGRERQISFAHPAMEPEILRFEASLVVNGSGVTPDRSRESGLLRQIEDQREIGIELARCPAVERSQLIEVH